jgi:hypothetical protein
MVRIVISHLSGEQLLAARVTGKLTDKQIDRQLKRLHRLNGPARRIAA